MLKALVNKLPYFLQFEKKASTVFIAFLPVIFSCTPEVKTPSPRVERVELSSTYEGVPMRLAQIFHEKRPADFPESFLIPLDTAFSENKNCIVYASRDRVIINKKSDLGIVQFNTPIQAALFNRVKMRMVTAGMGRCTFSWRSDRDPQREYYKGLEVPLVNSEKAVEYIIKLDEKTQVAWSGEILGINLHFSDAIKRVNLLSIEFFYEHPEIPIKHRILNEEHDGLPPLNYVWTFTVPDNARFRTQVGINTELLDPKSENIMAEDGVEFEMALWDKDSGELLLKEVSRQKPNTDIDKNWEDIELNFSSFAGKECKLELSINPLEHSTGDFAFWGGPMVYQAHSASEATPIILISIDTLRRDNVGCYGYFRDTTPNIDALSRDGIVFEDAITPVTWTLPSHGSMFTGLSPQQHNLRPNMNLDYKVETLGQNLGGAGYVNFGATGHGWWLLGERGFSRGMDHYETPVDFRFGEEVIDSALSWISKTSSAKLFMFLHFYDVHSKSEFLNIMEPYHPGREEFLYFTHQVPQVKIFENKTVESAMGTAFLLDLNARGMKLDSEALEYIVALYDDSIRYVDAELGRFIARLKELGLYERAAIIITSDHGESFAEHGIYGHEQVYDECARIPLVLKLPGNAEAGRRISGQVVLSDIYPTLVSLAGGNTPEGLDGISLLHMLENGAKGREHAMVTYGGLQALRTLEHKYIYDIWDESEELYSLLSDPLEMNNIVAEELDARAAYSEIVQSYFIKDNTGWTFHADGRELGGRINVSISAENRIASYELRGDEDGRHTTQWDIFEINLRRNNASMSFGLNGGDTDTMLIRPYNNSEKFTVTVDSTSEILFQLGAGEVQRGKKMEIVLDPQMPNVAQDPQPIDDTEGLALLRIWYEPVPEGQGAAPEMDENIEERLRGLGYLGDE